MQTTIGSKNVKLDLVDPATSGGAPPPPPPPAVIAGNASNNTINGSSGDDVIHGLGGSDKLYGNQGNDRLEGGSGNDSLWGGSGADTLLGGDGRDALYGGTGLDVLTGGAGSDRFVFDASLGPSNVDKITDFSSVDDTIYLENGVFTALISTGTLNASAFFSGTVAQDSSDRVIYNPNTGALTYDPDGTGTAASVEFAQVSPGLSLQYHDFLVV